MLLSHDIIPVKNNPVLRTGRAFSENFRHPKADRVFATEPGPFKSGPDKGKEQRWWQVSRLDNDYNNTPYWIVRSPAEICNGHTDIWNDSMVDMMAAFFRLAQPLSALNRSGPTKMTVQAVPKSLSVQRVEPSPAAPNSEPPSPVRVTPLSPAGQAPAPAPAPAATSPAKPGGDAAPAVPPAPGQSGHPG